MIHSDPTHVDPRMPGTPTANAVTKSRWRLLPEDVLEQSCKRVGIAAVVFASLWALALFMNNVVHHWLRGMPLQMVAFDKLWPMPGKLIAGVGVAISVALVFAAPRQS